MYIIANFISQNNDDSYQVKSNEENMYNLVKYEESGGVEYGSLNNVINGGH